MSEDEPQGRLFNPDRFSPVTLATWMLLPRSSARVFAVATCIGKSLRRDSTFMPLRHGKDVIGVVIQRGQRKAIEHHLNMSSGTWRMLVSRWVALNIAHRCARETVCLFVRPFEDPCPYCKADVPIGVPTEKRNPQKRVAQPTEADTATVSDAFVPNSGDAYGMKRGMEGSRALMANVLGEAESNDAECLRCRRFGDDHGGSHIRSWKEIGS
jgi:hypothetical protein